MDVVVVRQTVDVRAERARIWRALTREIGEWWPRPSGTRSGKPTFRLDSGVGGYVVEDWGDGQGAVWAAVTMFREGEVLQLSSDLTDRKGLGRGRTTIRLETSPEGTRIHLEEVAFGTLSPALAGDLAAGWGLILRQYLGPFVEDHPHRSESG
jgi:uncharacterized protein YndB with AHSA1/START domain